MHLHIEVDSDGDDELAKAVISGHLHKALETLEDSGRRPTMTVVEDEHRLPAAS